MYLSWIEVIHWHIYLLICLEVDLKQPFVTIILKIATMTNLFVYLFI